MKISRILSVVIVLVFVLTSTSVFAANFTVTTTTTYNVNTDKVDVVTSVSGLTEGSMTSYLVYDKDATLNTLTGSQIVYIDQKNNSTATTTFNFTMDKGKNYASSVLVGNDKDTPTSTEAIHLEAAYLVEMDSSFTDCQSVTVTSVGREGFTHTFAADGKSHAFPAGYDLLVEFTPKSGKVIDSFAYSPDGTAAGYAGHDFSAYIVGNKIKVPAATLTQSVGDQKILLRAQDDANIQNPASDITVSIDSNVLKDTVEVESVSYNSLTYFCTVSDTKVEEAGIDLYVYENAAATEPAYKLEDLQSGGYGDGGAFAIRIVDMLQDDYDSSVSGSLESMFSDQCVYVAIPYYKANGSKISIRNGTVSNAATVLN